MNNWPNSVSDQIPLQHQFLSTPADMGVRDLLDGVERFTTDRVTYSSAPSPVIPLFVCPSWV